MKATGIIGLAIVVALLVFSAVLFRTELFSSLPEIDPDDPAQVALGRGIYAERCAMCHGANLEGQPDWMTRKPDGRLPAPPHDASGHTWHHPDQQLMLITKKGLSAVVPGYQSDMPAFADKLSDTEIWAVLGYIKSIWPQEQRAYQKGLSESSGRRR